MPTTASRVGAVSGGTATIHYLPSGSRNVTLPASRWGALARSRLLTPWGAGLAGALIAAGYLVEYLSDDEVVVRYPGEVVYPEEGGAWGVSCSIDGTWRICSGERWYSTDVDSLLDSYFDVWQSTLVSEGYDSFANVDREPSRYSWVEYGQPFYPEGNPAGGDQYVAGRYSYSYETCPPGCRVFVTAFWYSSSEPFYNGGGVLDDEAIGRWLTTESSPNLRRGLLTDPYTGYPINIPEFAPQPETVPGEEAVPGEDPVEVPEEVPEENPEENPEETPEEGLSEWEERCRASPDLLTCSNMGDVEDLGVPIVKPELSFEPVDIGGVGLGCPSDISLPMPGSPKFSYDFLCEGARMMRPIILVYCSIVALMIVAGMGSRDS